MRTSCQVSSGLPAATPGVSCGVVTQAAAAPGRFPLYHDFSRAQWAALRGSVPMTVLAHELAHLEGLGDVLSLDEVEEIYLPLWRLARLHAGASRGVAANTGGF